MRHTIITLTLLLVLSFGISAPVDAQSDSEFIFLDELIPGMEGYALTVADGILIEKIPLKLKGIIKDRCFNGRDMMLIETWGDVVDYTYGIAGGMSGSPIYFEGRLAGAVSGHWLYTNQKVGIGTPIQYMLENLDYEDEYVDSYDDSLPFEGSNWGPFDRSSSGQSVMLAANADEAAILSRDADSNAMIFVKASMPIIVSGLEPWALAAMKDSIETEFGGEVLDIPITLPWNVEIPSDYVPGSCLATMFSRGDIQYGSYGTVTYVTPDNRVLGFGHSMGRVGRTELPMAFGYIYGRRPGINKSNKYGGPTELCGVITQDRGGAISGYFGVEPRMVPLKVSVSAPGVKRDYMSEVTGSRFYFPTVASSVAKASILRAVPQYLRGVLKVDWRVEFEGGKRISRSDLYGGDNPISQFGTDMSTALAWAIDNRFGRLAPLSISIRAIYSPGDEHSRIVRAELVDEASGLEYFPEIRELGLKDPDSGEWIVRQSYKGRYRVTELVEEDGFYMFEPGDSVYVHITEKIRYAPEMDYIIRLIIPDVEPAEAGAIQVRGGTNLMPGVELIGSEARDQMNDEQRKRIGFPIFIESLDDALNELNKRYSSGEIIVEAIFTAIEDAETFMEAEKMYEVKSIDAPFPVSGFVRIPIKIKGEKEEEKDQD